MKFEQDELDQVLPVEQVEQQPDVMALLRQMQESNLGQQEIPQPNRTAQILTGIGSILKRDADPLAAQERLRQSVQGPVIAQNARSREALMDKLKIVNAQRDELGDQQTRKFSDPSSAQSLTAQDSHAKRLVILSQRGGHPIELEEAKSFVVGKSAKELKEADPFKDVLEVLKLQDAKETTRQKELDRKQAANELKEHRKDMLALGQQRADQSDPFRATMDKKQADTFQSQLEQVPDMENREKNLNAALAVADRVLTGPLAGNEKVYFAQKLKSEDAQRLEQFLSEENVRLIMKFAKEAGVRSVDTEAEQQRLLKSIANKTMTAPVLKETLAKMKRVMNQSKQLIQAKQKHYNEHGNLRGFDPGQVLQEPTLAPSGKTPEERRARIRELQSKLGR